MRKVTIIGAGPGNPDLLPTAARNALDIADVVIGAHRALSGIDLSPDVVECELVRTDDIVRALTGEASWQRAVVVMTGDTGLFSGAKRLVGELGAVADLEVRVIPGVSSASYLAARLGRAWQTWRFASAHGTACDIVEEAAQGGELFLVTSGGAAPAQFARALVEAGLPDTGIVVGERLSYPDERITCARAGEIAGREFDDLNVMLFDFGQAHSAPASAGAPKAPASSDERAQGASALSRNDENGKVAPAPQTAWPYASSGIPDELFARGGVPMTKAEVRAVALSKLRLASTDTVWDVGAGTGSVSVEAALVARAGAVWSVERKREGIALIKENAERFGCGNVFAVEGEAPYALAKLPAPDAVFVGGSSGRLAAIVQAARSKNPRARFCVPCVTVETLGQACEVFSGDAFESFEVCQVSVARAEETGSHHLMRAQNPVFLVSARGANPLEGDADRNVRVLAQAACTVAGASAHEAVFGEGDAS